MMEEDVFDEDGGEGRSAEHQDWEKLKAARYADGYREGISEGKEKRVQAGFDAGFSVGFATTRKAATLRGKLWYSIRSLDVNQMTLSPTMTTCREYSVYTGQMDGAVMGILKNKNSTEGGKIVQAIEKLQMALDELSKFERETQQTIKKKLDDYYHQLGGSSANQQASSTSFTEQTSEMLNSQVDEEFTAAIKQTCCSNLRELSMDESIIHLLES